MRSFLSPRARGLPKVRILILLSIQQRRKTPIRCARNSIASKNEAGANQTSDSPKGGTAYNFRVASEIGSPAAINRPWLSAKRTCFSFFFTVSFCISDPPSR